MVWELPVDEEQNPQAKTQGSDKYLRMGEVFHHLCCSNKQNTTTKSSRHARVLDLNPRSMHGAWWRSMATI